VATELRRGVPPVCHYPNSVRTTALHYSPLAPASCGGPADDFGQTPRARKKKNRATFFTTAAYGLLFLRPVRYTAPTWTL